MQEDATGTKPLVITNITGGIVDVASMNRKGFTKSTEQGELWLLHAETGRVLPYEGGSTLTALSDEGGWYHAIVGSPTESAGRGSGQSAREAADQGPAATIPSAHPATPSGDASEVLGELCAVIAQRRRERPEGSYTTYLFDAGEEKIRKKTGEEAIELVLARRRDEVVSEAADLIYHLLVLLNQLDIPLDEVIDELARRA